MTSTIHDMAGGPPSPAAAPGPEQPVTPRSLLNLLTVETVLYALIFTAAVLMRFIELGERPLAPHEAALALPAWQFLQGLPATLVGSPLILTFNLLAFFLGAPTDATPRILPAIVGCFAVLLPALVRRELGRTGALIASFLLLISTSMVYFSRDVNGVETCAVAGVAAVIWLWRYLAGRRPFDLYLAALAAAVALTGTSAAFTILLAAALWLLISGRIRGQDAGATEEDTARLFGPNGGAEHTEPAPGPRVEWRNALLLFAAAYVGLSTALLVNREGLGLAFNLLGAWLTQFSPIGPVTMPLTLLLVYEPLILIFGLAALLLVWGYRGERWTRSLLLFLGILTLVGLVVYSLAGLKSPADLVVVVIPLALLAGWFLGFMLERAVEEVRGDGGLRAAVWGELPILLVTLAFITLIYLQFITFLSRSVFSPGIELFRQLLPLSSVPGAFEPAALLLLVLGAVILGFIALAAAGWIGTPRTANLAAATVAIILLLASVRAMWLANYSTPDVVHELIAIDQTPLQARDLLNELEWQSEWRDGDRHVISVSADPSLGPVVGWYLRAFPNLKWSASVQQQTQDPQAMISADDASAPAGAWMSERFRVGMTWGLTGLSRVDLFRWLIFRQGGDDTWQTVRLWVQQVSANQ